MNQASNMPSAPLPPVPTLRSYVINFDATHTNLVSFHRYLADSRDIVRWWNYIPLSYFVKTHLTALTLQERVAAFVPTGFFIIAEVNPYNINGRLPQDAWSWFYEVPNGMTFTPQK